MGSSKYDPLGVLLSSISDHEVILSWKQIENVVGELPADAKKSQFWANTRNYHQSRRRQWLDAGFEARFDSKKQTVTFTRVKTSRAGKNWSRDELRSCVSAYHQLLTFEANGQVANKTQVRNRVLQSELLGRSAGSYEFRMQNISSVLGDLGLKTLEGYKPLRNIGSAKETLVELINEIWGREGQGEKPTGEPDEFSVRVMSALSKEVSRAKLPPLGNSNVQQVQSRYARHVRDPNVAAWVLNAAHGVCEVCGLKAPFIRDDGVPFLEVHHVLPLAENGPDTVHNTVAACPNCHRELHHGKTRKRLARDLIKRVPRLRKAEK